MDVLLDTNILARSIEPAHPHHRPAHDAIATLAKRGDRLCLLPQVLYEYFVVCTRPQQEAGGMGMSNPDALAELRRVQALFHLLPDPPNLYSVWLDLIERHRRRLRRSPSTPMMPLPCPTPPSTSPARPA